MLTGEVVNVLTVAQQRLRIGVVPRRIARVVSFGKWLKYVRSLTELSQKEAAEAAQVSYDAVKRIERGELVGSAHFLGWLSWLDENKPSELEGWERKLMIIGKHMRRDGLAMLPPKIKKELIERRG